MTAYFWTTEHEFPHSWEVVTTHFWSRYPNPNSGHVFSEDLIECGVEEATGVLCTKKLIIKTNKLPWWGKHLFSARKVAVIEETLVDPRARTMTTYTRNIGLRMFMGTTEKNLYRDFVDLRGSNPGLSPEEVVNSCQKVINQRTVCEKNVWIESDIVGLRSAIKKFGLDRFKVNCVSASDGLTWAIDRGQLHTTPTLKSNSSATLSSNSNSSGFTSNSIHSRAQFMTPSTNLAN